MRKFFLSTLLLLSISGMGQHLKPDPASLAELRKGKFIQRSSYDTTGGNNDRISIPKGKTATIFNETGPGEITRIWITIDSRDPDFLRKILIRMYWDDENTPSVEVPVGDFFGCGFEYKHHASHYIGMTSGGYYSYFPMPFNKKARIEIANETNQEVFAFYYHIGFYKLPQPQQDGGYFHAHWNREIKTTPNTNYIALEAKGRGHLVGVSMNAQAYNGELGFLEGDEMIYVDGETTPSVRGTGLEDYFTSGWYFKNGEFAAPYHGLTLLDNKRGRVTAYHHHVPDAIPFEKSLKVTFEHGDRNQELTDMSTVTYWYQQEPHGNQSTILKSSLRIPLRRVLPEDITDPALLTVKGATREIKDMTSVGAEWLNGKQLILKREKLLTSLEITGAVEKVYDLELYSTVGPGYNPFSIYQEGGERLRVADTVVKEIYPLPAKTLRSVKAIDGTIKLFLDFEGTISLDAIRLVPHREFIVDWFLLGPFSNLRENDYARPGLDFAFPPEKEIDLNKSYSGVNNQTIAWQRYTGGKAGYDMKLRQWIEPDEFVITYALTYIYSPTDQSATLLFGSDDASKIFLNDQEVHRFFDLFRIATPDQDKVKINLKKGWNKLLVKVENNFGGYAFYARIIGTAQDIKFSPDKK